jgi:hypothetical protein
MSDSASQEQVFSMVVQTVVSQLLDRAEKWLSKEETTPRKTQEIIVLPENKDVIIVITVEDD